MEVDGGNKDVPNGEPDAMWDSFRNALRSGPPDGAAFLMANMKDMLTAMTATMAEKNLDFDMTASEKKAVARLVAKQFLVTAHSRPLRAVRMRQLLMAPRPMDLRVHRALPVCARKGFL